jgi:nucleotide-binding universal stress UspA family protein
VTTILVPLDGSALAERALPYAAALARAAGDGLRLVRACPGISPAYLSSGAAVRLAEAAREREQRAAADEMAAAVERLGAAGVRAEAAVRHDAPADAILAEAEASGAGLTIMSTHGRGGASRLLHGSVADEVLRRAALPVLMVPPTARPWPADGPSRVLVALDGSALAEAGLAAAERLARPFGAELLLLRVVDPPGGIGENAFVGQGLGGARRYLDRLRRRIRAGGLAIRTERRVGPAAATIAAAARERGADAIALGTRGRGGLTRLVLGSTAEAVLRRASVPLLLVPAAAASAAAAPTDVGLPRALVRA